MTPERSGGSPTSLEAELIELKARVAKVCAVASMGDDWASGEHPQTGGAMSDRPECAECPHSHAFDGLSDAICCEKDPTAPRCESCGVPFVKHLGLTGTCADKERYLSLLRRVIRMTCLTIERCPAGYSDVAEFLREEEARK